MTVAERTQDLVNALENNYKEYTRQSYIRNPCDYSLKKLTEIDNGTAKLVKFRIQSGRKYYKLIQQDYDTFQDRNEYRDGGVHAFVDKKTGDVFKPAGWQGPAKYARYNLLDETSYQIALSRADWAGGYLYMR
tara:strand:- start:7164 stop:7562 length:399 start_codon:yes stop_codon:yes gene_type:complete